VKGFTLLWSKILDSSIWMESKETRLVWITMLAMKDAEGVVLAAPANLAHRARVSDDECQAALHVFLNPDKQTPNAPHEGRRIREVPGGWVILNHDVYRFSTEAKREFWRQQKAAQREAADQAAGKKRLKRSKPGPGEIAGTDRLNAGDELGAARVADDVNGRHAPLVPPGATIIPPVMPRVPGSGLPPMPPASDPGTAPNPPLDGPDL